MTNTDSITVTGSAGTSEHLTIDESGGAFAPGATPESTGLSEIEIAANLGDTSDVLVINGTPGNDTITIGVSGIGLNSDTDNDVTFTQLPSTIEVHGLVGVNTISARGGFQTGAAYTGTAILYAGDSGDHLTGGAGNDQLYGGAGNDSLDGFVGNDTVSGGGGADGSSAATGTTS